MNLDASKKNYSFMNMFERGQAIEAVSRLSEYSRPVPIENPYQM